MTRIHDEDFVIRTVVLEDGEKIALELLPLSPGRYRHQNFFEAITRCVFDDAYQFGGILEVEEVNDGRLLLQRYVVDHEIESVSGRIGPRGTFETPEFYHWADQIMELGGFWEVTSGLFSAWVPKEAAERAQFKLDPD